MGTHTDDAASASAAGVPEAAPHKNDRALFDLAPEAIVVARGSTWRLAEANRASRELFLFDLDEPLPSELTAADVAGERWVAVHEGFPLEAPLLAIAAAAHRPLDVAHRINEFTVAATAKPHSLVWTVERALSPSVLP